MKIFKIFAVLWLILIAGLFWTRKPCNQETYDNGTLLFKYDVSEQQYEQFILRYRPLWEATDRLVNLWCGSLVVIIISTIIHVGLFYEVLSSTNWWIFLLGIVASVLLILAVDRTLTQRVRKKIILYEENLLKKNQPAKRTRLKWTQSIEIYLQRLTKKN